MTARKTTLRPRRVTAVDELPKDLCEWFAGVLESPPWCALISPDCELLRERWATWAAGHPRARPPAGYQWLAGPPPERRHGLPYETVVLEAKRRIARVRAGNGRR